MNAGDGSPVEEANMPLDRERVHLKFCIDYRNLTDKAYFYYILDNIEWQVPHGGDYVLTAEATDDDGETATSTAVEITIMIR